MNFVRLLPVLISFLLLGAHFYRAGQPVLTVVPLIFIVLLMLRRSWVPWIVQLALLLGAIEWLRTIYYVAQMRIEFGQPWMRMAVILGVVALFTALSCLVFRSESLRKRYHN